MAHERADSGSGGRPDEYRRRCRCHRSSEARGDEPDGSEEQPVFAVQSHDASTMHLDLRPEVGGVLKSWAVPKGPSTDPHVKRLATRTEDHPLDYRGFEDVIAKGECRGATVMVRNDGTFPNLAKDRSGHPVALDQAVDRGHASFRLDRHKLHGAYAATRMRGEGDQASWLKVPPARHGRLAAGSQMHAVRTRQTYPAKLCRGIPAGRGGGDRQ